MRLLALVPFFVLLGAACGGTDNIGNEPGNDAGGDAPLGADVASDSGACNCVPQAPSGWNYVEYTAATRPTCPADFGTSTDTIEGFTANPASCTCSCSGFSTGPSCTPETTTLTAGATSCKGTTATLTPSSSCNVQSFTNATALYVELTGSPTGAGTCQPPTAPPTTAAPTINNQGRACGLTSTSNGSCGGTQLCLPSAPSPFSMCVEQSGDAMCPPGFPTKHTTGSSLDDTRGCDATGCSCGANVTCDASVFTFYSDSGCTTAAFGSVTANGTCDLVVKNPPVSFNSYAASSSVNTSSCGATGGAAPTGGVALVDQKTICCQ